MPGRAAESGESYRYGYQGQYAEEDGQASWLSFELRNYDPRIARWTSIDPAEQFHSPYVAMGNDPVNMVDPDGAFVESGGRPLPGSYGGEPSFEEFANGVLYGIDIDYRLYANISYSTFGEGYDEHSLIFDYTLRFQYSPENDAWGIDPASLQPQTGTVPGTDINVGVALQMTNTNILSGDTRESFHLNTGIFISTEDITVSPSISVGGDRGSVSLEGSFTLKGDAKQYSHNIKMTKVFNKLAFNYHQRTKADLPHKKRGRVEFQSFMTRGVATNGVLIPVTGLIYSNSAPKGIYPIRQEWYKP